jgi:hypothetical protein
MEEPESASASKEESQVILKDTQEGMVITDGGEGLSP